MEFLTIVKDELAKAAEFTVRKTGEAADYTKLKLRKSRIESEIKNLFGEIGECVYTQYKEQTDTSTTVAEKCLSIDEKKAELQEIIRDIGELKEKYATPKKQL